MAMSLVRRHFCLRTPCCLRACWCCSGRRRGWV